MADAERKGSILHPRILSRGTQVSQDIAATRRFYEGFLELECAPYSANAMLVRDRDQGGERQKAGKDYWVMDVRATGEPWTTNLFKHWGIDVASPEEVDRVHAYAAEHQAEWGIKTVRKPRMQHGTYSFYIEDLDGNWWEFECRPPGEDNDAIFAAGDVDAI